MADVNSNININFNTADALAQLRRLQAGLSRFHQSLAEGNLAAANAQKGLNAQLIQSIGATGKFAVSQSKVASSTLAFTNALEKNKLSLREYYRYSMAAATANTRVLSKAFAQEREIINRARRDRVKALQAQYIQMAKSQGGFIEAIRIMPRTLMMANGQFTELGTRIQYAAQRQQFLNQLLKQGSTQLLNFGKNTQWAGRQLMVGLTIPLAMLGGYASKSFRELEEAIVKFRRVYGDAFTNESEVNAAVENIRSLANEYTKFGVAVKDTMDMAATAAAAGFAGADLTRQVETATKLAVLGQVEQQQALETTISLQNAFGLSSEELASKINFLNAVENQTVLSIEDLTIAIPKAAPVIKQLGGNVEDLAFFLTAMKEGGINASEGANALKSGLASLINPSEKAAKFLGEMGINLKGIVEANKGDVKATVVGFARALDTLDPLNRARAIEQLFGKFQFARLSTLFQNVSKDGTQAARAFDLAGASVEELAVLSEREMKKIEESVGVKFQAAVEQFKQDIMPLGKAFLEAVTPIVKFFSTIFEKFNGLSDGTKKVITVITALVAGVGPVLLMTFGLLMNGVANLIKLFAVMRGGIAKLNGQTNVLGAGFNYVTQEQLEQQAASQALHNTHTRLIEVFNIEKAAALQLAAAYRQMSTQMAGMAAQNPALFAGGLRGAASATSKLPKGPVGFKDGIISVPGPKGAGDVVPAMVSPGEAIIPAKTSEKYRGLITAMFQDKVPGFATGRLPWGNAHPVRQSGATDLGMPKTFAKVSQSRQIAEQISKSVQSGKFGKQKPTDFGTLLQPFSGRSFPIRGVGGVYRKPNGELVVVKPTMDEKTALAEVRATQIARDAHGLIAPKQTIKTMIDPTDPAGQRKLIVLESPYDPRIAAASGKFTKQDMIKQLVAANLRGDKDLSQSNVSGKVLADVGTAGVFDRASGFREFAKTMPSMEQQALINLLGVKGGAKKFFAQQTSGLASQMSPKQYHDAIVKEIDSVLPKLKNTISKFDLNPYEKTVYADMISRLEAGKKVNWEKFHKMHVAAGQGIPKYDVGNNPDTNKSVLEKQLSKYVIGNKTQSDNLITQLKQSADDSFAKQLEKLDDKRRKIVETAWKGGSVTMPDGTEKSFSKPRQTTFLKEISNMIPVKIGDEVRYVHEKDFDKFKQDPAGRSQYARTSQQVIDNLLYRMGASERNGSFVAKGKFTGRFAALDHFVTDLRSTGKGAGGGRSVLSKIVRLEADRQRASYLAQLGDPLRTRAGKTMLSLGYSPSEVREKLKPELSHLNATSKLGIGGRDSVKFSTGYAQYDPEILNRFMNTTGRHSKILNWNSKNNPLGLTPNEINDYKKAADFMSKKNHPVTKTERLLVAKAAELDQRVIAFKKNGGVVPAGLKLLPSDLRLPRAISAVLKDTRIKPSAVMNLAATDPGAVLAKAGEYLVDKTRGTAKKLSVANTKSRPMGAVASTGKIGDNLQVTETPTTKVMTRNQVGRLGYSMIGRADGDPTATKIRGESDLSKAAQRRVNNVVREQERLLRQKNKYSKKEIDNAIKQLRARKVEDEIRKANNYAQQEALRQTEKLKKQKEVESKSLARQARQERVSRYSGGTAMALGTAGMGLMMAGQQTAGMAAMGVSAVAGMAPMLMNPYIAAGVAVTALAGSFWLADKAGKRHAEAMSKLVDATSATTEKMQKIGELTNTVGASEIMARRRNQQASNRFTTGFERGKQRFGTTFLESEVGKDVLGGFKESLVKYGTEVSASQMATQLGGYVSDGVLSAEQAHSVAEAIGLNLKNTTLGAQISGQLLELIGPEGQDLLTSPLETRVRLVQQQRETGKQVSQGLATNLSDYSTSADNIFSQLSKLSLGPAGPFTTLGGILQNDRLAPGFLQYSAGEMFGQTQGESMASGAAAIGAQNLEFNQSQIDSLTIQYEKEIAKLEKEKASTANKERQVQLEEKIADLKAKQDSQTSDLRKVNGDILKDQIAAFKVASKRGAVEDAFFDSLKNQVKTKWAEDPMAEAFLKTSADLDSKELEVKIDTVVASGQMSPMAAVSLMQMFGDDEKGLDRILTVSSKFNDPGKFMEVVNFFGGFKNKEVGKKNVKLITNMARKNPEEADKLMSTLALMQKMDNKEINLEAFFEGDDAQARLADLANSLQQVEDHKGPFTLKALTEIKELGGVNLDGILSRWSEFENLPDEVKKTVIQEYVTLYKTIDDKAINAEIARRVKAAGGASTVADYYATEAGREAVRRDMAGEDTMQKTKQDIASKEASAYKEKEKSGSKQDPYEDIMRRLKNVRNAAINAAGGFKELQKAISAAGSKSVANKFVGVEQQLMKKGYSDDFINYISGLDPEAQKEFGFTATKKGKTKYKEFDYATGKMKTRTQKYKKGDFVLTDKGNAMRQAMDKAVVGEFQIEQQKVIKNINEQNKAYKTLKAAGLSNLEIEKAMENQAYVTAIATGKITAQELKTNNALTKQALLREQIKGITDKTKVNETRIDALKSAPELINFLSGLKTLNAEGKEVSLSITSIYDAIQDPEDLIRMVAIMNQIKAGTKGSEEAMKELFSFISGAEAAKDLEKNLLTPLEKFQKAYDAAMKIFDAYKQMDEYTLKAPANTVTPELGGKTFKQLERTKTESDEVLAAMNAELAIYEHQISMIRDEIAKIESEIENMDVSELDLKIDGQKVTGKLKYVLEDLKEKISDWEREIEMKYERPIKTLQDESNALSNDLQIIDYKADKINEKYDDQVKALEEVQKVNESIIRQQEQQLDLADALTQGDISAAARAAQAMRSSSAEEFATGQTEALAQARENEIDALTSASGMTRDQIEERRWQISQQIYALENDPARLALEKSIQEAKDAIYAIEEKREDKLLAIRVHEEAIYKIEKERIQPLNEAISLEALKNLKLEYQLTVLGNIIAANDRNREVAEMTREQWEEMLIQQTLMDEKLRKDIADALASFNRDSMTAEETWKRIKDLYDAIKDKTVTITVKYVNEGDGGGSGGGGGGNGDGGNGDGGNGDGGNGDGTGNGAGNGNGSGTGNNTGDNKTGSGTSTGTSKGNTTQGNNALTNATTDINYGLNTGGSTAAMHQADLQNLANKIMVANVTKAAGQTAGSHLNDLINMNARADAFSKSLVADSYAKKGSTATLHLQDLNKTKAQQKASADAFQAELKANAARKAADEAAKKKAAADIKKFGGNAIAASQFANWGNKAAGGLIKRFAFGGTVIGTDTVPAMLTPGEFVMSRYAVNSYGVDTMKAINNGDSVGDSVYNYSINVNVKSDANPDEIAQAVMTNIQRVNSQKLRSVRL